MGASGYYHRIVAASLLAAKSYLIGHRKGREQARSYNQPIGC
jgi:hypothetical protein